MTLLGCTECVNPLDYSVVVIPVTTANKTVDVFNHEYEPLNEVDRKNWQGCKYPVVFQSPLCT